MNKKINDKKERAKPLILIVDDFPKNLQVLANIIKSETDYNIAAATSGVRALKIVENILPDLVLLDVMMPDMDGLEVCRHLKTSEFTRDIPVIFLTAKSGADDIVNGFGVGAVDYITKPFNGTELLARMRTHLELKRSRQALRDSYQKLQTANRQIVEKNEKIEEIIYHLTDSINYGRLIQNAIMHKKQDVQAIFKESFVFFKPRDIVSGDFFWISGPYTDGRVIIAAVDCTGHGVPGAFISILSYQLMNEIIVIRKTRQPDAILNQLHEGIKSVFNQEKTEIYGGMDVAVCCLDPVNRVLEFSGARNPLFYFHNDRPQLIKGDRFTVGGFKKTENRVFTKQVIKIQDSSMFYIFTDGFPDQLGGNNERRFTRKKFQELLQHIHHLPMKDQEAALEKTLSSWRGREYDQIDDILVIGFRL
jgi:CheY-like chemotaxis protein